MTPTRELSTSERREIRSMVTTMCANYDRTYDCCPLLDDCACYMLMKAYADNKLCRYFREAILPLSPTLEATLTCKSILTKPCAMCGKQFPATGRRIYCSDVCEQRGRKAATARRVKRHREKLG